MNSIGHWESPFTLKRMGGATHAGFFLCSPAPLCPYRFASTWWIRTPPTPRPIEVAARIYSGCEFIYTYACVYIYMCRVTHNRHETEGFSRAHLAVSNDNARIVNIAMIFDPWYESIERNYDFICSSACNCDSNKKYDTTSQKVIHLHCVVCRWLSVVFKRFWNGNITLIETSGDSNTHTFCHAAVLALSLN